LRPGVEILKQKRQEMQQRGQMKKKLRDSKEFVNKALLLAEKHGWVLETEDDISRYLDTFTDAVLNEVMVGMAPIGSMCAIGGSEAIPSGDSFPGLDVVNADGQRAGPRTSTQSGDAVSADLDKDDVMNKDFDKKQTKGPDSYPGLSTPRKDGQKAGPKADTRSAEEHHPVTAESLHSAIYNSLAGKRVRSSVNEGRSPSPVEIKEIAESEGFTFGDLNDVDNFMKMALVEKLYTSTGPTGHASQMAGDKIPGAMSVSKEMQRLGPKDGTVGQNSTGARDAKAKGTAPSNNYKDDGPKGSTQQFEKEYKVCPVCSQKNLTTNAHCGACGAVLPPHPEDKDGGIPVKGTTGGSRNTNVATDGGTPKVRSPYGGSKSKHVYLQAPPKPMKENIAESQIPESSRVVIYDMLRGRPLDENVVNYAPQGVHDPLSSPDLGSVNAKAKSLGVNPIEQDELNRVVGMFQQGETVGKTKLYTGVELRLCQAIANMMGIGASHGIDKGMTDNVTSADLNPGK